MESTSSPRSNINQQNRDDGEDVTQKLFTIQSSDTRDKLEQEPVETTSENIKKSSKDIPESINKPHKDSSEVIEKINTVRINAVDNSTVKDTSAEIFDTTRLPAQTEVEKILETPTSALKTNHRQGINRGKAILYISLLLIVALNALNLSYAQFIGPQGWAFVIGGPGNAGNDNPLVIIKKELNHGLTPGATSQTTPHLTPQQYINLIVQNMTLDQELGQMMIVQFVGPSYSLDISTMISQYHVGAVLLFTANNNISDKVQLEGLIQQMQSNSAVPMAIAIDQEGGTVDRLQALDGPRSSAASIGATNDPTKAVEAGIQDSKDLASYGFNLNLAPVVDVTNVYNPQLYGRTYGNNAALVTKMAQAYLQGLQQSGKVLGTLKHFPGLGDVGVDPHSGVPNLYRSKSDLETIDWAPYRALIQQGNVHAIMVTHEIVHAIDSSVPSSLSYKVVTGILRNELGFQGVIMTDSLTMESITAYYTEDQAAAVAVEAGSDLLMGASTPADVASMIQGIKQAIDAGSISRQRIDDSVRRILMLKYQMGLLPIPNN
ncbi:MAG: glycoside hydrolase family 3 protein [Ktedonobacteraceae bacterium]